jgi:Glucosamine-6-phosphate isomerases/6-phosphogluconolactonase
MKVEVYADADSVSRGAAAIVAAEARAAIVARGRFVMAVSGGRTPWLMLRALARKDLPWDAVHCRSKITWQKYLKRWRAITPVNRIGIFRSSVWIPFCRATDLGPRY